MPSDPAPTPVEIESTTVDPADVVIHGHPFGRLFVDVHTRRLDVQLVAESVTLNGGALDAPDRAIHLPDVSVTHAPASRAVDIRL